MSLDEAIKYYSHLADECRRKANIERYDYMDLKDLAAEHGQLADWLNELKVLREKIRVLLEKQEQDRWIPVTERLPEKDGECRVTVKTEFGKYVGDCFWNKGEKQFENWNAYLDCYVKVSDVTAWKPIEEPYTEEDNE